MPCSLQTHNAFLGITYKFRATAVKATTFSSNLHAQKPLSLLRSLSHDALEYQQTLEIENTWPEKLMYSLMIPHKVRATNFYMAIANMDRIGMGSWRYSVCTCQVLAT